MTTLRWRQNNFTAGELTPLLSGRRDFPRFRDGVLLMRDFFPNITGPAQRRGGTRYIATGTANSRLLAPFIFSVNQAYVLEFGDRSLRIYRNRQALRISGSSLTLSTPYLASDLVDAQGLPRLSWTQSADVLFLFHPSYPEQRLERISESTWRLQATVYKDGPYLPVNQNDISLRSLSHEGNVVRLEASRPFFKRSDLGRILRLYSQERWGWGKIVTYQSSRSAYWKIYEQVGVATTTQWRWGLYDSTHGYPRGGLFFEDRFFRVGPEAYPQRLDASRTGDYENYAPSDSDGLVVADHALSLTLNSDSVNAISWLSPKEDKIYLGTSGGEWRLGAGSSASISAENPPQARRITTFGSAPAAVVSAGDATVFLHSSRRHLHEFGYSLERDGFTATDLLVLAEHLAAQPLRLVAYQGSPQPVLWIVREDGRLLGLTYARSHGVIAAHLSTVAGSYDGGAARVESLAVIPTPQGKDELWLLVKREISGRDVVSLEVLEPPLAREDDRAEAFYVDAGVSYKGSALRRLTGLNHLEGEEVTILADGVVQPLQRVRSGAVTLASTAARVHVGLAYGGELEFHPLQLDDIGAWPSAVVRVHKVRLHCDRSAGGTLGRSGQTLRAVRYAGSDSGLAAGSALYSGIYDQDWPAGDDQGVSIVLRQDQPLPMTLLAIEALFSATDA